jgi:hypothetical protein
MNTLKHARSLSPDTPSYNRTNDATAKECIGDSKAGPFNVEPSSAIDDVKEPSEQSEEETPTANSIGKNMNLVEASLHNNNHPIPDIPRPNAISNKPDAEVGKPDISLLTIPCTYPATGRKAILVFRCKKLGIGDLSQIDWNDKTYVDAINQWRNQIYRRGGSKKREGVRPWHPDEVTWVELYLYLSIIMAKEGDLTKMPAAGDGVALLNEHFEGTTLEGSDKVHEPRDEASFSAKLYRLDITLRNELKNLLNANKALGKKSATRREPQPKITEYIFEQCKTRKDSLATGVSDEKSLESWIDFLENANAQDPTVQHAPSLGLSTQGLQRRVVAKTPTLSKPVPAVSSKSIPTVNRFLVASQDLVNKETSLLARTATISSRAITTSSTTTTPPTISQDAYVRAASVNNEYGYENMITLLDRMEDIDSSGPRPARNGHAPVPLQNNVWNFAAINHRVQRRPSGWVAINHPQEEAEELEEKEDN